MNKNTNEIIDGEFTVLGKIIKINSNNSDSISLLRNTPLNLFQKSSIQNLLSSLEEINENEQFNIPTLETEITGQSLMIIPIAIYNHWCEFNSHLMLYESKTKEKLKWILRDI